MFTTAAAAVTIVIVLFIRGSWTTIRVVHIAIVHDTVA
jgi:hypothetical protein